MTFTPFSAVGAKPVEVAVMSYFAGRRFCTRYSPEALAFELVTTPVASLFTVMVAFGTAAPVASLTTPAMLPLVTWAAAAPADATNTAVAKYLLKTFIHSPQIKGALSKGKRRLFIEALSAAR